jgi:hypothetical protein
MVALGREISAVGHAILSLVDAWYLRPPAFAAALKWLRGTRWARLVRRTERS